MPGARWRQYTCDEYASHVYVHLALQHRGTSPCHEEAAGMLSCMAEVGVGGAKREATPTQGASGWTNGAARKIGKLHVEMIPLDT